VTSSVGQGIAHPWLFPGGEIVTDKERKRLNKTLGYAVRFLQWRMNPERRRYVPTVKEELDFLNHHPRLAQVVEDMDKMPVKDVLPYYLPPGRTAALCYLMSVSASSKEQVESYFAASPPDETFLDFSRQSKAYEFWTLLGNMGPGLGIRGKSGCIDRNSFLGMPRPQMGDKRKATGFMWGPDGGDDDERIAVIIHAWKVFLRKPEGMSKEQEVEWSKENLTCKNLRLKYRKTPRDKDGRFLWNPEVGEWPDVGGVDLGPADKPKARK
jgi:hypothetical protein